MKKKFQEATYEIKHAAKWADVEHARDIVFRGILSVVLHEYS